ncbi:MAG TPA: aldehyde dehydrogenase family protein, partial [Myxococcales bacterium]|nr:aldehyde dehydrogenase family protein [Myxococcales bacterium]
MMIQSTNPATGKMLQSFEHMSPQQVDEILSDCAAAQKEWKLTSMAERTRLMNRAADLLEERAEELGRLAVLEMGKPIGEGIGEVKKCAWVCRHYAEHTAAYLEPKSTQTDGSSSYVRYDPLGVVLAIMPWNFPYWQVFRFIAPNLMAGNGGILKHAPNVPQCALAIERIMTDAGFPEKLFCNLFIDTEPVAGIIADKRIAAVTLTGSERAGRAVGEAAGKAIKPMVLELGGSDPFIVLADADVKRAAQVAAFSRCMNNGQSCIAAKRFIVMDSVHDQFVAELKLEMESLKM